MFPCPMCETYLSESDLIQRNPKSMGNIVVEYDARCPRCSELIGHVSWGQFAPFPELADKRQTKRPVLDPDPKPNFDPPVSNGSLLPSPKEIRPILKRRPPAPAPPEPESPPDLPVDSAEELAAEEAPAQVRLCPHCGQPWPETE